jgi:hypothetical protein
LLIYMITLKTQHIRNNLGHNLPNLELIIPY